MKYHDRTVITAASLLFASASITALPAPAWAQTSAAAAATAAAADFTVGDGPKPFTLSSARGRFVAVHFLLKTECPICLRTTAEYLQRTDEVAGVRHVFVKPDDSDAVQKFRGDVSGKAATPPATPDADLADLPIYRDADATLARQLKVKDGYPFHGTTTTFPTTIIFDRAGAEVYRFTGEDNTKRLTFDAFAAKIKQLDSDAETREGLHAKGIAVEGYDVVAYFDGAAAKGQESIASSYKGVTYRFANAANRARFAADPAAFAPQYGGWCAYAMADGDKVEIDPKTYKVTNGKLYLFYNGILGNTLKSWNKNEASLKPKADSSWSKVITAKK